MENQNEQLQTPQQPPMMVASESPRKPNILAMVLGGMLLIVLAVGGTFIYLVTNKTSKTQNINQISQVSPTAIPSPSIDETANWGIYTGSNFTFKYPSGWKMGENEIYNPASKTKGGNGGNETIYTQQLAFEIIQSALTVKQYVDDIQKRETSASNPVSLAQAFTRKQVTINGQQGEVYTMGGEGYDGSYTVLSNGKSITVFGPVRGESPTIAILNQIISTFKFTDKTQATDTSSWKTYTNNFLKFTIKYPETVSVISDTNDGSSFILSSENNSKFTIYNYSVHLNILSRGKLHDSAQSAVKGETCGGCVVTTEPININNAIGVRTTSGFVSPENYYVTDAALQGQPVRIYLSYGIDSKSQSVNLFRQIIQTFKFVR